MSNRSLRVRRGIWVIHEMTVTYENIQNVKVQQGPVQRLFGISNLIVETAGGSAEGGTGGLAMASRAVIEGVRDAEPLRDRILEILRGSHSMGLSDESSGGRANPGAGRTGLSGWRGFPFRGSSFP